MIDPGADAFDQFEIDGWRRIASDYRRELGPLTKRASSATVDAAQVAAGHLLLDVGTGPGYVAAEAILRGVDVVATDIAESMVDLARRAAPTAIVEVADARHLPYTAGRFDAVTAGFVLLHTAMPERMVAEAARVLKPGGRFAASVYDAPARARFVGLFGDALAGLPVVSPAMPPGPGLFDLASRERLESLLGAAGFEGVDVTTLGLLHQVQSPKALYDSFVLGTVRAAALLAAQSADQREPILAALGTQLEPYRSGDHYEVPVSFLLVTGRAPLDDRSSS
ncbi:class I SAM-dependent methyltransferase [Rhodococcus globerulus]|uniref:Class I SAM-dependent methyltransferase n=1 Tax=Rhodococcus globerulus TaxID=33008 RepID=A0ABU4C3D1_RHOGO|nr:class I SAM-dependent methyltransferase [Rhodococcus globerulus]MDV6271010.1 class I SAM-dependent methyltransferase [Rhodococcus globerulus]